MRVRALWLRLYAVWLIMTGKPFIFVGMCKWDGLQIDCFGVQNFPESKTQREVFLTLHMARCALLLHESQHCADGDIETMLAAAERV